jgi:hypothetical protein
MGAQPAPLPPRPVPPLDLAYINNQCNGFDWQEDLNKSRPANRVYWGDHKSTNDYAGKMGIRFDTKEQRYHVMGSLMESRGKSVWKKTGGSIDLPAPARVGNDELQELFILANEALCSYHMILSNIP